MKKVIYIKTLVLCLLTLMLASCNKESLTPGTPVPAEKYLEFKDFSEFHQKLNELNKKDSEGLKNWEKSIEFTTLHRLYEQIMQDEIKAIEEAELKIKQNVVLATIIKPQQSPLLEQCKEMVINTNAGLQLNLFDPGYAKLLNKDGVIKIQGALYKFGSNNIKTILDGDYSQIKHLDKITEQNQTPNLKYIKVSINDRKLKNAKTTASDFTCVSEVGGYRLDGWVRSYFYYTLNTAYGQYEYNYSAFLRSTHRKWSNIFGWRSNPTNQYAVNANYSLSVIDNISWLTLPASSSGTYNESDYDGYKTNAYHYFTSGSGLVPNGENLDYADLTLSGTFNFTFYDCDCTASN